MLSYISNFKNFFASPKTSSEIVSGYENFLSEIQLNAIDNKNTNIDFNANLESDKPLFINHCKNFVNESQDSKFSNLVVISKPFSYESSCLNFFYNQSFLSSSLLEKKNQRLNSNLVSSKSNSSFYKNFLNTLNNKSIDFENNFSYFLKSFLLSLRTLLSEFSLFKNKVQGIDLSNRQFTASHGAFRMSFLPNLHKYIFEQLFLTILNSIVKDSIDVKAKDAVKYFPVIFTVFLFIMVCNLIGLVPYSSTLTSYFIVTISLTLMVLFGTTMILIQKHGIRLFGLFLPGGTPLALLPLMIPLEIMSYFIRLISLSVRLFANMMAGHILLAVIAGFAWTMAVSPMLFLNYFQIFPLMVVYVLVGLETGVALIQAYVFTLLSAIYINDALNIDH
jgi:ATP synthase subunit 6